METMQSWMGGWGVFLAVAATAAPEVILVKDGRPQATLVLANPATRAAQLAAFEIQHHVKLITGATLPLVNAEEAPAGTTLQVGETPAAQAAGLTRESFRSQEYTVKFTDHTVFLVGRDAPDTGPVVYDPEAGRFEGLPDFWEEQGTLHAAYDFLEKFCGVRWFNPTALGTFYPRTPTLAVRGSDIRRTPAFRFRDAIGATGDNPNVYDAYVSLWADGTPQFKAWKEAAYAEGGEGPRLFLLRVRNGGELQRCNHSLYGYYDRFWRNPATRRPELFAQGYEGEPPQLCYTSPELIRQVADDARHYYDTGDHRGIFWQPRPPNWFPVEPMDNGSFCQCPRCQAWLNREEEGSHFSTGTHSDYFFQFVNAVAQELHQTHPDKGLITLAYASHARPPQKVRLDPSVAVQFCFTSNRGGVGTPSYDHEIELLKAWAAEAQASGRPLYLWLYYTFPVESARNANLHCWPGFFAHAIGEQMKLFYELGYRGMFHCGFGQEVEAYVTFKLMDDPSLNVDMLLEEYFQGLYGPAAGPMKTLYLEIEKSHCQGAPQYTPERMEQLRALLQQARAQAQTDRARRNVELFELGVWSYMEEGFRQRQRIQAAVIPSLRVPRLPEAGGDVARVAWDRAAPLPGPWYQNNSDQPAQRKLSGRIAHDGTFLYLELVDLCDPTQLTSSAMVFPYDDWEVFVAAQRAQPYRQYASNPHGVKVALSHGEVNFRTNVPLEPPPFTVVSDTSAPDRWVTRMAWPLAEILPGGVQPGGKFYFNVLRVWRKEAIAIDAWGPFTRVHDPSRLPELTLE
jgi:hypothetical protein